MKKSSIFYILACMTSLFIFSSCEENVDQVVKAQPDTTQEITNRSIDDCEDCPQNFCCCVIELLDYGPEVELLFCGVYSGMAGSTCGPYSPSSPCSTIPLGLNSYFFMNLTDENRKLFCLANGASFRIENVGSTVARIRVSCRANELDPGWQYIQLDPTDVFYFVGGTSCFLSDCD